MATTTKQLFEESAKRGKEAFRETLSKLSWDSIRSQGGSGSAKPGRTMNEVIWDGMHAAFPDQVPAADPARREAALLARKARREHFMMEACARHEASTDS